MIKSYASGRISAACMHGAQVHIRKFVAKVLRGEQGKISLLDLGNRRVQFFRLFRFIELGEGIGSIAFTGDFQIDSVTVMG